MNIQNHPKYQKLLRQRTLLNIITMLLSSLFLYGVLSVHTHVDLSRDLGIQLSLSPWMGEYWWNVMIVLILGAVTPLTLVWGVTQKESMLELYPSCSEEAKQIGACSPQDLVEMTQTLAQKMGIKVSHVFLDHKKLPNAYTTYVLGRGNIVVLHSNLLEIMPREEVRAIIAHELGHIEHQDVLWTLSARIFRFAAGLYILLLGLKYLGVALLSTTFLIFLKRGLAGLLFIGFALFLFRKFHKLEQTRSHQQEFIADAHQAIYVSVESAISALILLNERSHALSSLMKALKKSDSQINQELIQHAINLFPSGAVSDDEIQKKAPQYYIHAHIVELSKTLDIELTDTQEMDLVQLLLQYREETQQKKNKEQSQDNSEAEDASQNTPRSEDLPFVWRHFDWNDDGVLQLDEIKGLVEALKKDPKALTDEEGEAHSHPSIRRRVLFLAELCSEQLEKSSPSS